MSLWELLGLSFKDDCVMISEVYAGSEKTKTDVATTHGQMIESNNINRSLLVLGTSINRSILISYVLLVFT